MVTDDGGTLSREIDLPHLPPGHDHLLVGVQALVGGVTDGTTVSTPTALVWIPSGTGLP